MTTDPIKENIELDARLVLAGLRRGKQGIMEFGLMRTDQFPTVKSLWARCDWLSKQPKHYITRVSQRVVALESGIPKGA